MVRTPAGSADPWKICFTRRISKGQPETRYEMQLDPACRWRVTRIVGETGGKRVLGVAAKYKTIGDLFVATRWTYHFENQGRESSSHSLTRPMSETERREFKQCVEQTIERWKGWTPADPRAWLQWLRRCLWAIVIVCPLGGVTLLGAAQRRKPPSAAVPPTAPARPPDE